jgi:hypothetical protein
MKTLLATAAFVLSVSGFAATASAQSTRPVDRSYVAMSSLVRTGSALADESNLAARAELAQVSEVAAAIEGVDADETISEAVERTIVEGAPEVTVVRTVLTGSRWIVRVNELGIPKSEYRKGLVVYHVPGQRAIVRQIAVERPYYALANDAEDYVVRLGAAR